MSTIKEKAEHLPAARLNVVDNLETSTHRLAEAQQHVRDTEARRVGGVDRCRISWLDGGRTSKTRVHRSE